MSMDVEIVTNVFRVMSLKQQVRKAILYWKETTQESRKARDWQGQRDNIRSEIQSEIQRKKNWNSKGA